jgi:hypothetical protein
MKILQLLKEFFSVNLNKEDAEDITPLQRACLNGDIERVRQLINDGADVNHQNKLRQTPLYLVCISKTKNKLEVIKLLLENCADPNLTFAEGRTLLHEICLLPGNLAQEIVELIIQNGAAIPIQANFQINKDLLQNYDYGLNPHDITMFSRYVPKDNKYISKAQVQQAVKEYLKKFECKDDETKQDVLLRFIRYTLGKSEFLCNFLIETYLEQNKSKKAEQKIRNIVPANILTPIYDRKKESNSEVRSSFLGFQF